ncbi:hypothetical protein GGS24DRAFT_208432 [Hypoxylon argillaceum]|nr:hypothetical protein GGS24DRAFT_208432 [Hypoxylon argillaceum]
MGRLSYHCTLKGCASYLGALPIRRSHLEHCSAGVLAVCILLHSRPPPLLIENSAKNLIRFVPPKTRCFAFLHTHSRTIPNTSCLVVNKLIRVLDMEHLASRYGIQTPHSIDIHQTGSGAATTLNEALDVISRNTDQFSRLGSEARARLLGAFLATIYVHQYIYETMANVPEEFSPEAQQYLKRESERLIGLQKILPPKLPAGSNSWSNASLQRLFLLCRLGYMFQRKRSVSSIYAICAAVMMMITTTITSNWLFSYVKYNTLAA